MQARELTQAAVAAASLLALTGAAAGATGPGTDVSVLCSDWPSEQRAQVEARIRASLLLETASVQAVVVKCEPGSTQVELDIQESHLSRPVIRRRSLEDDIVATVEQALQELAAPVPSTQPAPPVGAQPPATPTTATPFAASPSAAPSPRPPTRSAPDAPRTPLVTELELSGIAERWSGSWAYGAQLGLSIGRPRWLYGVVLARRSAIAEPATFELTEWSAAGRLQLTLPEWGNIRGALGAGVSLLATAPSSEVVTASGTLLAAPFAQLELSRPFWFGAIGLCPGMGARLFAGARDVRLNGVRARELPFVTAQASLAFMVRLRGRD